MQTLSFINFLTAVFFVLCYFYQFIYIFVALIKKPKKLPEATPHRYAVMISARNESAVIAELIRSIRKQNYPAEYVDIYVAADNCTDNTAELARAEGATVWERFDTSKVGKGYALEFLFNRVRALKDGEYYDGYFIFDADNLLDENYIREMNKTFEAGYRIITSYRNSKNYGSNWISAGYSLWFLREAKYLNNSRMLLGTSCAVSGTGFLVHREIIEKNGGWKHFLLTEDIEFTMDSILSGEQIGYCGDAILYDEQPVAFSQSWNQRMRWAKGFLQVFGRYGGKLIKKMFTKGSFSSFDMTMTILPAIIITIFSVTLNISMGLMGLIRHSTELSILLYSVLETLQNAYLMLFAVGLVTVITEWRQIHSTAFKKILYLFTFPIFMMTYMPITIAVFFKRIEWTPIRHDVTKSLEEVRWSGRR